jgi:hypothetical protein
MDMYIKKNDRCHPLGFPEESKRNGSFISERTKYKPFASDIRNKDIMAIW